MYLKTWRFVTILLTVVAVSAAVGHLLELPRKMAYDAELYVLLHRTLYWNFGLVGGTAEGLALISVVGLAWRVRHRGSAFSSTLIAAVCQIVSMGVFLAFVQPANSTMLSWPLDSTPPTGRAGVTSGSTGTPCGRSCCSVRWRCRFLL